VGRIRASASSKTAYGTAFCLAQRRQTPEAVTIVGLTSPANVDFTRKLGCYDDVVLYDDIASSLPGDPGAHSRPRANSVGGHPVSRVKAVVKALAD
jgi:uncharacterized protein DUF2855